MLASPWILLATFAPFAALASVIDIAAYTPAEVASPIKFTTDVSSPVVIRGSVAAPVIIEGAPPGADRLVFDSTCTFEGAIPEGSSVTLRNIQFIGELSAPAITVAEPIGGSLIVSNVEFWGDFAIEYSGPVISVKREVAGRLDLRNLLITPDTEEVPVATSALIAVAAVSGTLSVDRVRIDAAWVNNAFTDCVVIGTGAEGAITGTVSLTRPTLEGCRHSVVVNGSISGQLTIREPTIRDTDRIAAEGSAILLSDVSLGGMVLLEGGSVLNTRGVGIYFSGIVEGAISTNKTTVTASSAAVVISSIAATGTVDLRSVELSTTALQSIGRGDDRPRLAALSVGAMAPAGRLALTESTVSFSRKMGVTAETIGFDAADISLAAALDFATTVGRVEIRSAAVSMDTLYERVTVAAGASAPAASATPAAVLAIGGATALGSPAAVTTRLSLSDVTVAVPTKTGLAEVLKRFRSEWDPEGRRSRGFVAQETGTAVNVPVAVSALWVPAYVSSLPAGAGGRPGLFPGGGRPLCLDNVSVGGSAVGWDDLPAVFQAGSLYDDTRPRCVTDGAPPPTPAPTPDYTLVTEATAEQTPEPRPAGPRRSAATSFEDAGLPAATAEALPAIATVVPSVTGAALRGPLLFHLARIATCAAARAGGGEAPEGDQWLGVPRCAAIGASAARCLWAPILIALVVATVSAVGLNAAGFYVARERGLVRRCIAVAALVPPAFYLPSAAGYSVSAIQHAEGAGETFLAVLLLLLSIGAGAGAYGMFEWAWPRAAVRELAHGVVAAPEEGRAGKRPPPDCTAHSDDSPPSATEAADGDAVVDTDGAEPVSPDAFFFHPAVRRSPLYPLFLTADSYRDMSATVVRCGFFVELAVAYVVSMAGGIRPGPQSGPAACWAPAVVMMASGAGLIAYCVAVRPHDAGRDLIAALLAAALLVLSTGFAVLAALDLFEAAQRTATYLALAASIATLAQSALNVFGAAEHWMAHMAAERASGVAEVDEACDRSCDTISVVPPAPGEGLAEDSDTVAPVSSCTSPTLNEDAASPVANTGQDVGRSLS